MLPARVEVVIGLTGGIGAGKSTFASLLSTRGGATIVDVDAIGREVIAPGGPGADAVFARFGTLDRADIASAVFADERARHDLERISWPLIEDELRRRLAGMAGVVVLDMAVLSQGLGQGLYGPVVTVEAPEDVRLPRLVARGMSEADALARMRAQTPESHRRSIADVVVVNDRDVAWLEAEADRTLVAVVRRSP